MVLRVFIAVDVENPILVQAFDRVRDALQATGVPMKPVESHNYHLTLRFIGEVDEGVVRDIASSVLGELRFTSFEIHFKGVGAFPGPYRPRVVWIGVQEGADQLKAIRDEIESRLRSLGIKPDPKRFEPHLTIARIKGARNLSSLIRLLEQYSDYDFGWMRVESIRLKKSTLTRSGPIYETLWEAKATG